MIENNLKPGLEILDKCKYKDWQLMEEMWIGLFKSWNIKLVNGTRGGEGSNGFSGKKHSEKTKQKLRILSTGRKHIKKNMGESNPRCKLTDIDIIKMRELYKTGIKISLISKQFNISKNYTNEIVNNKKRVLI